jgi:hypothetical protein
VRYIHLNPVVAGIAADPAGYRWSSHHDYLGRPTVAWLDADFVLRMFGPTVDVARGRYVRFMRSYKEDDLALFDKHESRDTRELEPERSPRLVPARTAKASPAPGSRETLEQLAERHCARLGISAAELTSPSRARRFSHARQALAKEALAAGAATVSEIARFLGRSPSALTQQLTKLRSGTF